MSDLVSNNEKMDVNARMFAMATKMIGSDLLPSSFKKAGDVFLALEISNRLDLPTMMVFQSLYIVQGRPIFSGSFCRALINKHFKNVRMVKDGTFAEGNFKSITLFATDSNGNELFTTLSKKMIDAFGWFETKGSMWNKMPDQMASYRVSAFFLRDNAPEILCGARVQGEDEDDKVIYNSQNLPPLPPLPKASSDLPKVEIGIKASDKTTADTTSDAEVDAIFDGKEPAEKELFPDAKKEELGYF